MPSIGASMPGRGALRVNPPPGAPIHCVGRPPALATSTSVPASRKLPPALPLVDEAMDDDDAGPPPLPVPLLAVLLLLLAGPPPLPLLLAVLLLLLAGPPPLPLLLAGLPLLLLDGSPPAPLALEDGAPPLPPEPLGLPGQMQALNWKSSPQSLTPSPPSSQLQCGCSPGTQGTPPSETTQRLPMHAPCAGQSALVMQSNTHWPLLQCISSGQSESNAHGVPGSGSSLGSRPSTSSSVSAHVPEAQAWPGKQSVGAWHCARHWPSTPHTSGCGQSLVKSQSRSAASWQTARGLSTMTHRCSAGQSRVCEHSSWQREKTQTSGAAQSLASEHVAPAPSSATSSPVEHAAAVRKASPTRAPVTAERMPRRPEGRRVAGGRGGVGKAGTG
jgi:hypothetical protein